MMAAHAAAASMRSGGEPGGLGNQPLTVGGGVCGAALPSHFCQLQCDSVTLTQTIVTDQSDGTLACRRVIAGAGAGNFQPDQNA